MSTHARLSPDDKLREAAIWWQIDAEYLYRMARRYQEQKGREWLAVATQRNAGHSAEQARLCLGRLPA